MTGYLLFTGAVLFVVTVGLYIQWPGMVRETLDTWRWVWRDWKRARRAWRRRK